MNDLARNNVATFKRVAQCLYRHSATGIYYGLVKRSGKQFRRSLRTTDRKLAERLLADFRQKVSRLSLKRNVSSATFIELAHHWAGSAKAKLKPKSARRIDTSLHKLSPYFGIVTVR